jgi:hypothetical protein
MSYLRYLLLLDIHIFYHFANKRIPHTLIVIKSRDLKQEISCSIEVNTNQTSLSCGNKEGENHPYG